MKLAISILRFLADLWKTGGQVLCAVSDQGFRILSLSFWWVANNVAKIEVLKVSFITDLCYKPATSIFIFCFNF